MSDDAKLFGDTDDAALFGDEPKKKAKSYPDSPRLNKQGKFKGQPESTAEEDERLGVSSGGPIKSFRVPGTSLSVPLRPHDIGELENERLNSEAVEGTQRVEGALGMAAVGGALGAATKSALAARAATSGGVVGRVAAVMEKAVENSFGHGGILGTSVHVAKAIAPGATAAAGNLATKVLPAAVRAGAAGAATLAPQVGAQMLPAAAPKHVVPPPPELPEASPVSSLHNAVDRLRASAIPGSRAADLMARIEAAKNTPPGTVTQGTLGGVA